MIVKGTKQLGSFKRGISLYVPKDRVVVPIAPITLGPPLPSTISLQGGWTSSYGTNIDGYYVKGNGTFSGTTIFYVNSNISVEDGYPDGFDYHPVLFFDSASNYPLYGPWIILADDIAYKNSSTNNQAIPSTNWTLITSSQPAGTIQAVN